MIYFLDCVGHGELIENIQQQPLTIILFDQVEKAHPRIWDTLLKILNSNCLIVSFVFMS